MTVLDEIIAGVREDMEQRRALVGLDQLQEKVKSVSSARDAYSALKGPGSTSVEIIAEVKRASPSKGDLGPIPDPARLARDYQAAGAAAISVLTEQRYFKGSLEDFDAVREEVSIPLLRKDFVVDPYMIWEARAHGADLILLIVAALTDEQLKEYLALTHRLGMRALVETHTEEEIRRATELGARIIGVNVRNLKTLDTDRRHFARMVEYLPEDALIIAESGVSAPRDVADYAGLGAEVVLVGEALVRSDDARSTLADFKTHGRKARAAFLDESKGRTDEH